MEPAVAGTSNNAPTQSLEGFDQFYAVSGGPGREQPGNSKGTASTGQEQPGYAEGIGRWLTVEEAAKRLGISANAVIKRLGKGKLHGRKVAGQFGEKWLVDPDAVPQEVTIELSDSEYEEVAQEQPGNSKGTASTGREQPGNAEGIARKSIDVLGEVIRQQTEQIKVQNEVIRQLVDQVRDKDSQLKLLTTSQQKTGWWNRFCSWFTGR